MPENNEHKLQVGVGFKVTDQQGGINDFSDKVTQLNDSLKTLAETLASLEGDITKLGNVSKKTNKETVKSQKETTQNIKQSNKDLSSNFQKENTVRLDNEIATQESIRELSKETARVQKKQITSVTTSYRQAMNERKAASKQLAQALKPLSADFSNKVFNGVLQYSGARAILNEFQNLGRAIVDINYNTINNQRLMGDFSNELRDSLNASAADIARNTGIMITDAQEIQGAWIRINEKYAESAELLDKMSNITAKFMNVGDVEEAEEAVKLLNSTLLQFDLTSGDVAANMEEIANKFAYMADVTAMGTADEYAEGIAKMGANVKNMNGDVDDAIVLLSIVGDKLAKNGIEAGNSLNTFTAYMQRAKTLNLFDELAVQLGDANIRIRDGEKGLKSYEETLRSIASAYSQLKAQGDQQGMNQIVEALGATRQRATAQALLEAISATDENGNTALDTYYALLSNATSEGNYLEEQNEALMTSLRNQFNSLSVTIQEAGMTIANAGVLDSITLLMNGAEGLISVIKMIPQPVISVATGFVTLKTALTGLEKMGEITGYSKALRQELVYGTKEQMAYSDSVRKTTDIFLNQQKILYDSIPAVDRKTEAYEEQKAALTEYELKVAEANTQLAQEKITLDGYNELMGNAHNTYLNTTKAIAAKTQGTKQETSATRIATEAERQSVQVGMRQQEVKKKSLITLLAESGQKKKDALIQTVHNNLKKISIALTTKGTAATIASTVAEKAAAVGKTLLAGATTALGVAMHFLLSPMVLVTAAMSALTWITGRASAKLEESRQKVDEYKDSISEATDRVAELKQKQRESELSGTEEAELEYLNKKIKAEKELLRIEQQKVANDEYTGTGALWWREDGKSDDINDAISDYNTSKALASLYATQLAQQESSETAEKLTEANKDLSASALELSSYYDYLKTNIEAGTWSGDALEQAEEDLANLESMMSQVNATIAENSGSDISNLFDNLSDSAKDFNEDLNIIKDTISGAEADIEKLISGASSDELGDMIEKYDGFIDVVGKSTAEQIAFIRDYANTQQQEVIKELDTRIEEYVDAGNKIHEEIQRLEQEGVASDDAELNNLKEDLEGINVELEKLLAKRQITIEVDLETDGFHLGDLMNQMDGLVESTKSLVEAQNQLANGTALSKQALWELAMQYPEMLYQANLFADGSVAGQEAAVNAILDMKKQEFDNAIDLKIAELEGERDFIKGVLDLEQQKLDILTEGTVEEANGELAVKGDLQEMLGQYNDAIGEQHTLAEQYKLDKTAESAEGQANAQDQASEKIVSYSAEAGEKLAANITEGGAAGAEGLDRNSQGIAGIFNKIIGWASKVAKNIAKALAGDTSGGGTVGGSGGAGNRTNTFQKATYNSHDNTINGMAVGDWIKTQKDALKLTVDQYKVQLSGLNNAIANLQDFKKAGLTGVSNKYSSKGAGGKGSDDSKSGSGSKSTDKNTDSTDKNTEAVEKLTEQYIKNVEDLQKRIVDALKEKYQQEYDERKKLLEEEHQARLDAIQKEIDALNGNTPEDKQSELARLQAQYEKWSKDDSTLGKQKQKEYLDQIKELEKEIKLDELEQQMEEENENYENSIDSDSEFYDAILAKLDQQMTDEALYREANDMIRNGKIQDITDLLTKFDSDWSGWATLMGQSAGEIIAEQVAEAISNYVDVMTGNVTPEDSSSSGGSSSGGSSGGTSGKTISKGRKVKITNTSASMYLASDSKRASDNWKGYTGSYYVVNMANGRVALAKSNDIKKAIGWIDKKHVVGLASGGYTGNHEGIAMLHKKERVLNSTQTAAFEHLVYTQLPKLEKIYSTINHGGNGNTVVFNKELMKVDIGEVNNYTEFDVKNFEDDLDRMFRVSLQKSGIRKRL